MNNDVIEQFIADCAQVGIDISQAQVNLFRAYFETLVDWNNRVNLTSITEPNEVFTKHFLDSLLLSTVSTFQSNGSILDVGAGAGFPSVPLKLAHPDLSLSIIDSLNKRILFLKQLFDLLHLNRCEAFHGRAEDFGQQTNFREQYGQVTARAVARLVVLSELCLPFTAVGGYFYALKGPEIEDELTEAKNAIDKLGGEIQDVISYELPRNQGKRTILVVQKVRKTPKSYPRKAGTPAKSPILS